MRQTPTRQLLALEKARPCMACGDSRPPSEMHFVRRPDQPGPPIAQLKQHGIRTVAREIYKCVLLCASCHYKSMRGEVVTITRQHSPTLVAVADAITNYQAIVRLEESDPEHQARLARWREEDGTETRSDEPPSDIEPPEGFDGLGQGGIPRSDPRWLD